MNAQGEITELQILSASSSKEIGPAIALELNGKTYAPIHERQGQIVCLINASGKPAETYRYTAFGEETLYDADGVEIEGSEVGNSWRFAGKRTDPETGWVYFGRRYYERDTGRWTTTDPLSFADGPNLYAYLHHNPLNSYDAYGLYGEAYRDSCEAGRNSPHYSPYADLDRSDNSCQSESFAYISSYYGAAGSAHGCIDFITNQLCGITHVSSVIGANEWEEYDERESFYSSFLNAQSSHLDSFNNFLTNCLGSDPNNAAYQNSRYYTNTGLTAVSFLAGGYGIARAGYSAIFAGSKAAGVAT